MLLGEGLRASAGIGSVRVRPCGDSHTYVEFHTAQGVAVLRFASADLTRFLARTYTVVAPDEETVGAELDHGLAALFGGWCDPRGFPAACCRPRRRMPSAISCGRSVRNRG